MAPHDLGDVDGARLTFTDAALTPDGQVVVMTCAEASADAVTDGDVLGCRAGVIEDGRSDGVIRLADVRDAAGTRTTLKVEGIEADPDHPGTFVAVVDVDRHDQPALLGQLHLRL